jgi:hypothetical protein
MQTTMNIPATLNGAVVEKQLPLVARIYRIRHGEAPYCGMDASMGTENLVSGVSDF